MLTQERLKQLLDYDPKIGVFFWKIRVNPRVPKGSIAGSDKSGYITICIKRKMFKAHRLAWFYVYGVWPVNHIDHINHDTADNRICNLRDVSRSENMQNRLSAQKNNLSTGVLGVYLTNRGLSKKYTASLQINGKSKHLGYFATADEAYATYLKAKRIHHSTCIL